MEKNICQLCGKNPITQITTFYYDINCNCCENKHIEVITHCDKCVPQIPTEIHPTFKDIYGALYKANINNILPIKIEDEFIIDDPNINHYKK